MSRQGLGIKKDPVRLFSIVIIYEITVYNGKRFGTNKAFKKK